MTEEKAIEAEVLIKQIRKCKSELQAIKDTEFIKQLWFESASYRSGEIGFSKGNSKTIYSLLLSLKENEISDLNNQLLQL